MDRVRIGVVGCGAMGQGHLDVWSHTPGADVTAVCDGSAERAECAATRYGATPFDNLDDMLGSGRIDAVDICTPSGLHAEQGLAAAAHGLHVLVEKPLDLDVDKADRLVAECDRRGLVLACVFQRRTYRAARQIAEWSHAGEFGVLLSCSARVKWHRPQSYYASAHWRGTRAMDGGVLANQAIHALDHLCWLAGPVTEVEYACLRTAAHTMEAEDDAVAVLRFASGARGVIEATTCCQPDLCSRVELYGTRGAVAFDDAAVTRIGIDGEDRLGTLPQEDGVLGGGSSPMAISMRGHEAILADFVEAVRTGRAPIVPGAEALHAVDALCKIYAKAGYPGHRA